MYYGLMTVLGLSILGSYLPVTAMRWVSVVSLIPSVVMEAW